MKKRQTLVKILAIIGLAWLTGCQSGSEIKIGVIVPLEGSLGDYGFQINSGVELAEKRIRELADSGELGRRYSVIYEMESADPNKVDVALESFEKLRKQGVVAIIGAASSSATIELGRLANKHKIVLLSPASSSPDINKEGGDFVYRNYPSDTLEAQQLANVIFNKCSMQKVLMVRGKNAYSEGITYELLRFARKSSRELPDHVVKFSSDPSQVDFEAVVDQIVEVDPDAVFLGSYADGLIPLIKSIRLREELKGLYIFTSSSFLPEKVVKALGAEMVEGIVFTSYVWDPESSEPMIQEFKSEFESTYHTVPGIYAATGYDAMMLLAESLDGVNTRLPNDIRGALNKIQHQGLLGETDFNKRGDVTRIPVTYWMKDGVKVAVTNEDLDEIKREHLTRTD